MAMNINEKYSIYLKKNDVYRYVKCNYIIDVLVNRCFES